MVREEEREKKKKRKTPSKPVVLEKQVLKRLQLERFHRRTGELVKEEEEDDGSSPLQMMEQRLQSADLTEVDPRRRKRVRSSRAEPDVCKKKSLGFISFLQTLLLFYP